MNASLSAVGAVSVRRMLAGALLMLCVPASAQAAVADADLDPPAIAGTPEPLPSDAWLEVNGARVGTIIIDNKDVFDLDDPKEDRALYRTANRLHANTRPSVIQQQLLFREGDRYQRRRLDESARILRDAHYLYDASITPIAYKDGYVTVLVTTHDVWTLRPGLSFGRGGGSNSSKFALEELNLLGTGNRIGISHRSGVDRDEDTLSFGNAHVRGSWIGVDTTISENSDGHRYSLELARPFYALEARWAAALTLEDEARIDSRYDLGAVVDRYGVEHQLVEVSRGWSAGLRDGWARRWTIGVASDEYKFAQLVDEPTIAPLPANRTFRYPWIGFEAVEDRFAVLRNHDQIGRSEDFAIGARFAARIGYASDGWGSSRDALLYNAEYSRGLNPRDDMLVLLASTLNGRWERGSPADLLLDASARFYWSQSEKRLFFATAQGAWGNDLDLDHQVLLGGDNGLRGYPLRYQSGNSRALFTVEQRYFTDWYPFRLFRVGGAVFADAGRSFGDAPASSGSRGWLTDVGVGLRLGNTRSGRGSVIHVDLAFPLDGDSSIDSVQLLVESKTSF